MPATAGRVRMPANNRVHSSAALQTHGIWQSAIGYDPYAPNKDEKKSTSSAQKSSAPEPEAENAYASFQGLLALARVTGSNADEARGSCKKCGRVGHLTFQCRNFLSAKDEADREGKDPDAIQAAVLSGLEKLKGERVKAKGKGAVESEESSEEEESESSDSEYDSEIERAIAARYGKRVGGGKLKSSSKSRKRKESNESDDDDGSEDNSRRKRGRSKKRRSSTRGNSYSENEDEGRRKRRKEKRSRRYDDDSADEEEERRRRKRKSRKERRRRSHRHSDDSSDDSAEQSHKRRSRKAYSVSDSDVSGSDDYRVGRDKKRSEKKSRKHRRDED